jgi:hypothetical protein
VSEILLSFLNSAALEINIGSGADSLKLRITFWSVVLSTIMPVIITTITSGVSPTLTESGLEKFN